MFRDQCNVCRVCVAGLVGVVRGCVGSGAWRGCGLVVQENVKWE